MLGAKLAVTCCDNPKPLWQLSSGYKMVSQLSQPTCSISWPDIGSYIAGPKHLTQCFPSSKSAVGLASIALGLKSNFAGHVEFGTAIFAVAGINAMALFGTNRAVPGQGWVRALSLIYSLP